MKLILCFLYLSLIIVSDISAETINLDFSSGIYNTENSKYSQNGYIVEASVEFHAIQLNTLAWYDTDNIITISSEGQLFNLDHLTVVNRAFAGLVFESSNGGLLSIGSISGQLSFDEDEWKNIEYFTVTSSLHSFDILNQIDNISLTKSSNKPTVSLAEIISLLQVLSGMPPSNIIPADFDINDDNKIGLPEIIHYLDKIE